MKSIITASLIAAALALASAPTRACEQWDVSGQKTLEHDNGIVVLADFVQEGSTLGGKASFVARNLDPERPWHVGGPVTGVVENDAIRFRAAWQVRYIDPDSDSIRTWASTGVYQGAIDANGAVSGEMVDIAEPAKKVGWRMLEPAKCAAQPASSDVVLPGMENDTDRGGSDYRSFFLNERNPGLCQDACVKDNNRCRAWTYVRPGVQGEKPVCFLKDRVPNTSANTCCISGVAPDKSDAFREPGGFAPETDRAAGAAAESGGLAGAVEPGMENYTDRPGNDYNRFVLTVPSPKNCKAACDADQGCAAWTYVRPGVQQREAVCYVKRPAPAPVSNNCCISGKKALNPAAVREPQ